MDNHVETPLCDTEMLNVINCKSVSNLILYKLWDRKTFTTHSYGILWYFMLITVNSMKELIFSCVSYMSIGVFVSR